MRDYKHLAKAKKPKQKKYRKITILSAGALAVIYGYHLYDVLSIWMNTFMESDPYAPFAVVLGVVAVIMLGGGFVADFVRSHMCMHKKSPTQRMATRRQ